MLVTSYNYLFQPVCLEIHISKRSMEIHTHSMDGENMCSQKAIIVMAQGIENHIIFIIN